MAEGRPPQESIVGNLLPGAKPDDVLIIEGLVERRALYGAGDSGHSEILNTCDEAFLRPHATAGKVGRAAVLGREELIEGRRDATALEFAQQLALSGAAFRFSLNPHAVVPPMRQRGGEPSIAPTIQEHFLSDAKTYLSLADWGELASRRAAYNRQPNDAAVYRRMQAGLFATIIEVAYQHTLRHPAIKP